MPSVCFYFQVHQPFRVRPSSALVVDREHGCFDQKLDAEVMRKVANKCYLPTNEAIRTLVERYGGEFRVAYSITGVALEQMRLYAPEALESFQRLVDTGAVELLGETYHHSLASLYDPQEFREQVALHAELVGELFAKRPTVFRNTELIYDDRIGQLVADLGYRGILAEGADDVLDWRSPNFLYRTAGDAATLLLKNYRLSDDVAFRFSNRQWNDYPLTADKYADWIHAISGAGDVVNLFMDYETFGEHQWDETGIFQFLRALPEQVLRRPDWDFLTPTEAIDRYPALGTLSFPRTVSWADEARDLTAWRGNRMQETALERIYALRDFVRARNNPALLDLWRKLQTSDHFYYMCTKWFADGDVHAYFSPFESPYEAFVQYMNALTGVQGQLAARPRRTAPPPSQCREIMP